MAGVLSAIGSYLTLSHVMVIIYALNFLIALYIIFGDTKSPTATMAWIMILFMVPAVGLILYLILSQNIARMKIYKMSDEEKLGINTLVNVQKDAINIPAYSPDINISGRWKHMMSLNLDYADSVVTGNESVELVFDGREMFDRMIRDIRNAKYTIKACFYIIKDDEIGREFIAALTEKAREGVKVRLLLDALGSRQIGHSELREFKAAGGQVAFFFKPFARNLFFKINYRNHRKIVIIDNETGYIGGFNIAREYLGYKKKFGYWRDTQLIIRGDALAELNRRFYMDWRYATKEKLNLIESSIAHSFNHSGNIPIQIVSSGPESPKEEIKRAMMRMITGARESIYIQTPYLVPDESMMESLAMAARAGVDVRIMIPCKPDHMFVYRTTLFNAGRLINEGVHVYIYDNGFLHAKTLTVDGEVTTVGSANFDIRSFRLNFETNAFIYDEEVTERMNLQFEKDMEQSREYTAEDRAGISAWERIAESISRLLTEVL